MIRPEDVMASFAEVNSLPLDEADQKSEGLQQFKDLQAVLAFKALDIATNPDTRQGDVRPAEDLYKHITERLLYDWTRDFDANSELHQKAAAAKEALEEKFEDGVFGLVADNAGNAWVMHIGPEGIDVDSSNMDRDSGRCWKSVMANPKDKRFLIKLDRRRINALEGMTMPAFTAYVAMCRARGIELPHDFTLLTGEEKEATMRRAPIAAVNGENGSAERDMIYQTHGIAEVRIRPAVKIA
jgi:hypothetical protein